MRSSCLALIVLALGLPLEVEAQVPVVDDNGSGAAYGSAVSSSPVAASNGGAYAGSGTSVPQSAQGMLFTQLQQLQDEIAQLRGMLEEQQNQIQQMKQESLDRYQDIDRRLSASAPAQQAPSGAIDANAAPLPTQSSSSSEPADPAKEKLYYDAAFDLIKSKDFDKASQAFNAFLRKYPNSQYAGNAQYWLGEVNLAKGDLQGAEQAFAKVGQAYPQHPKVPDSLYKLADVERRMGNGDKARGLLQQVVSQYPSSSAAQLAQRDLQTLH